jgi:hypothetical protein
MTSKSFTVILVLAFSCSFPHKERPKEEPNSKSALPAEQMEGDSLPAVPPVQTVENNSFKLLQLLSGKVEIHVPLQLRPMSKRMFELKYPYENQNTTIAYSDEDATVSLLISPRQDEATQEELPKYQQMLNYRFGNNSSIDFKKSEIRKINGREFILIEMITPAVDTEVYNLMFITNSGGKLLMGTFNCTMDKLNKWKPLADQIVASVKVKD